MEEIVQQIHKGVLEGDRDLVMDRVRGAMEAQISAEKIWRERISY